MPQEAKQSILKKWLVVTLAVTVIGAVAALPLWNFIFKPSEPGVGYVSGNGRVEATEIDVATKLAGIGRVS